LSHATPDVDAGSDLSDGARASYPIGVGAFVERPDIGPTWKIGAAIVILLPIKKEK
jgi:hypothetical protein